MKPKQLVFEAIGTHWVIDFLEPITAVDQQRLATSVQKRIASYDAIYSRFRDDSLVAKMAKEAGTYVFPADSKEILSLYETLYKITKGAYTPLIGSVLSDAGYDASYSLQAKKLHTPPAWEDVLSYSYPHVALKQPALLDFGALGKGHLIDIIGKLIEKHNIKAYCIDAGGDILYKNVSNAVLRVGLEHPENLTQVIGVAKIANQSICGSAGNRRTWGKFHHIINPHTLTSPDHILATWVIADTALLADALATGLYFVEPEKFKQFAFQYLILYPDYSINMSPDFPAEIYYTK